MRKARNDLAHSGQILADIPIIANENDMAEKQKLKQGFNRFYHLSLDCHMSFTQHNAVVDIANILTLDELQSRDVDLNNCRGLLDVFITWEEDRGNLEKISLYIQQAHALIRSFVTFAITIIITMKKSKYSVSACPFCPKLCLDRSSIHHHRPA